ncbi:MAG: MlaD family protein [Bacteroidales bacterium]|nr:MlaD family protein [Bacteroidales bacterium]
MKMSKEIKIGLLVIGALSLLIWGAHFLKGSNLLVSGSTYYGVYNSVEGLNEGSPVNYKGFKVGTVREIDLHPQQQGVFLVAFVLNEAIVLPDNSVAQIYSVDIMGSKAIQLILGDSSRMLADEDTLHTDVVGDVMDQLTVEMKPIKEKTENLLVTMDSVLTQISRVFSEDNKMALNKSIQDFQRTVENLKLTTEEISKSMANGGTIGNSLHNLEQFTETLQEQSGNLATTMENMASLSEQLNEADIAGMVAQTDSALTGVTNLLNQAAHGEGSLGQLLNDETLYLNLTDASANLDRLLGDLRHNPDRYLTFSAVNFGKRVSLFPNEALAHEKGIVFKVKVAESKTPLDIKNRVVLYDMPVFEDTNGKLFIYTVGETSSYSEALKWLDQLVEKFPSAEIYALEKGRPVRLNRALRKVDIKN